MISDNAPARSERSSEEKKQRFWGELALSGSPGAGDADADRHAAGAVGASLARGAEPILLQADEAGYSPGAVWPWRCRSIGTARATDTDGNCEYSRHRPRAGSHQLLGGIHAARAPGQRGNAASRQAGGESLCRESAQFSRMLRWQEEHTPRRVEKPGVWARSVMEEQVQIPWCVLVQVPGCVPVPDGGSMSTG